MLVEEVFLKKKKTFLLVSLLIFDLLEKPISSITKN